MPNYFGPGELKSMKNYFDRMPNGKLTVVIRDDAPMICAGDTPSFRSIQIDLTDDQRQSLSLSCTGTTGGTPIYETVSKCFIEPDKTNE